MTNSNQQSTIFVSLTGDEAICIYDINSDGSLSFRSTNPAYGPSGALCLHPKLNILYDAHVESTTLASFTIDRETATLRYQNQVDTGIQIPAHMATDSTGNFLLTAYYGGGGISVHRINADGSIGDQIQHIQTGEKAHAVYITPDDSFVFVPHVCPTNHIRQFVLNKQTGQLVDNKIARLNSPDDQTGPRHICFRPSGDIAYVINEQGMTISKLDYDGMNGRLERSQHISSLPEGYTNENGATAHIEVHPNGKWLYGSNRGHDSIVGMDIADNGSITPFNFFSVPTSPRSFNIDATGHFLFCAGEAADIVRAFKIDQENGNLSPIADYDVGGKPFWVMAATLHYPE